MKEDIKILKEVFSLKNILLGIAFNVLAFGSMYLFMEIILYIKYF